MRKSVVLFFALAAAITFAGCKKEPQAQNQNQNSEAPAEVISEQQEEQKVSYQTAHGVVILAPLGVFKLNKETGRIDWIGSCPKGMAVEVQMDGDKLVTEEYNLTKDKDGAKKTVVTRIVFDADLDHEPYYVVADWVVPNAVPCVAAKELSVYTEPKETKLTKFKIPEETIGALILNSEEGDFCKATFYVDDSDTGTGKKEDRLYLKEKYYDKDSLTCNSSIVAGAMIKNRMHFVKVDPESNASGEPGENYEYYMR